MRTHVHHFIFCLLALSDVVYHTLFAQQLAIFDERHRAADLDMRGRAVLPKNLAHN